MRAVLLALIATLVDREAELAARPVKDHGHRATLAALFAHRAALQDQIATIRRAEKAAAAVPPSLRAVQLGTALRAMRQAQSLARDQGRTIEAAEMAVAAIGRLLAAVRASAV